MSVFDARELRILLAFALGMLIGTERERRRTEPSYSAFAGLRTFGLLGLFGGLLGYLDVTALVAVGGGCVGLLAVVAYVVNRDAEDRGVTTEIAMLVTYVLGVLAVREPAAAASAGVVVTVTLALRAPLHRAVREAVDEAELRAVLAVLVLALVLLPVLPDTQVGPYGAIHPPSLGRLVLLLMVVQGLGHVGQRVLGPRFGVAVAGLAGGFASSSATIAAMSMRAREAPEAYESAVAGALASCVATGLQYLLILGSLDPALLRVLALPLAAMLGTAMVGALTFTVRAARVPATQPARERPLRLAAALGFAAIYAGVTIASSALSQRFGDASVVLVSAAAGLVDAHSTAGSVASLHVASALDSRTAVLACLAALTSNGMTKVLAAWSGRHVKFAVSTSVGVVVSIASAWLVVLLVD